MKQAAFHSPDLHMHSVYSDGTDTPRALLQRVRAAGLDIFALTDHDTAQGCAAVRALLEPGDAAFVEGIEFRTERESTMCWATALMRKSPPSGQRRTLPTTPVF